MTITLKDLVSLETYRQGRDEYVTKMIAYKKKRRIKLGEHISLLFENKNTVLFQIQELINSEDLIDKAEIEEYIDIYSGMLPAENELSATLFIELDDQERLSALLVKLKGIENYLYLTVGSEKVQAVFEEEHDDRELTTSVHYLKFPLTSAATSRLLNDSEKLPEVVLELRHPQLTEKVTLSSQCVQSLQKDLM